jgi:threonine/homoserine/homoserine lactone efflux protein
LCTAASFTPGPNTTLSTALAANLGLKHAMRFVFAVPVGWGLLFTASAGGVGAMVVALPPLRLGIQVMGVGYLLWLALKLARSSTLSQVNATQLQVTFQPAPLSRQVSTQALASRLKSRPCRPDARAARRCEL